MTSRFHRATHAVLTGLLLVAGLGPTSAEAQTILAPWGNVLGIRVSGEPVNFEAGLRLLRRDGSGFSAAVKYLQRPHYTRRDNTTTTVESAIEGVRFKVDLLEVGTGASQLEVEWASQTNLSLAGVFYCFDLPDSEFADGTLDWLNPGGSEATSESLPKSASSAAPARSMRHAVGVRLNAPNRTLELNWDEPRACFVRRDASSHPSSRNDPVVRQTFLPAPDAIPRGYQIYLELHSGDLAPGSAGRCSVRFKASARPDLSPVRLQLDPTRPGRRFEGIGGNFRLQFPETDPAVIRYHLDHLRPVWGRFELCWAEWDPDENRPPLDAARAGNLHPKIRDTIDLARTLARQGMPLMVSAWVPPRWARAPGPPPAGLRGTALDPQKQERICTSLTDYLVFLKEQCGIEAAFLSFNEPETGVEVRQTPLEHAQFLRAMGPHLACAGLATRLLLGDTAHGTRSALEFLGPALADSDTHHAIGGVAFHSWRGCTADDLPGWVAAARQLGVPLFVTEAGADAHLHEYPAVRLEPWFQLQEIELYVRLCALAQPTSLMVWQLTTDYSLLRGGGVYGEEGPLAPTQRYWNLAQLAATPRGAFALPIISDRTDVTLAAFGDLLENRFAIHLVNRGNERRAILTGLPATITRLRCLTTDATQGAVERELTLLRHEPVELILPPASFTTLLASSSPTSGEAKAGNGSAPETLTE